MTVMSVTGPVGAAELGRVLVHEHIVISATGEELDPAYAPDRKEMVAMASDQLMALRDHGVGAIVDPCPMDLGRDPQLYAEVSQKSGVKIIFATGFYMESMGIPIYWRARDADEIADLYLHEIEHGVGDTGLRPGVIKAATGLDASPLERKVLAGAAMAQKESGVAIITHTENSRHGDVQQDIFAENGADLSRVMIGHQDEQKSAEPIKQLAARGTFVGIDRIGMDKLASDEHRADMIVDLVDSGLSGSLCLSQDCVCTLTAPRFPFSAPREHRPLPAEFLARSKPMTHVFTEFSDRLRGRGITESSFETMFRDNPRRLLLGS